MSIRKVFLPTANFVNSPVSFPVNISAIWYQYIYQARCQKIFLGSAFEEKVDIFDTAVQSRSS